MGPLASTATAVSLRPVTPADREFLVELYESTREDELSQVVWPDGLREAFVRMQFDLQDAEYHRANPDGSFDVVEVRGVAAGRLYVDRRPGDLRIVDIALLSEYRCLGVGRWLLTDLQAQAAEEGRIVSIHVAVHNRAAGLYERLGFVIAEDLGVYHRMEWTA